MPFPVPQESHEHALPKTLDACVTASGAGAFCGAAADAGARAARILLVDDYLANRRIAARFLECAGYDVDLAENGQQAVQAFAARTYDLVLMDVQMPVMDGHEATRAIRDVEQARCEQGTAARGAVPVVALTAYAEKDHIDRCLESGMNDFLTKPLSPETLLATVAKWTPPWLHAFAMPEPRPPAPQPDVDLPLDFARALSEFAGDRQLLEEVLGEFLATVGRQITVLGQAVASGDADTMRREAHAIKGGAANLTARTLSALAGDLERIGESGRVDGARDVLTRLAAELARLENHVQATTARGVASPATHGQESAP